MCETDEHPSSDPAGMLTTSKKEVEQIGRMIDQWLGVEDPRATSRHLIDPDDSVDRVRQTCRPASSNPVEAQRSQIR